MRQYPGRPDEARRREQPIFRALERDEKAARLDKDVRFHLALKAAHEALDRGDFDTAEGKSKEAIQIRPEDKEALALLNTSRQEQAKPLIEDAKIAYRKKEFSEAIRLLRKASDILPGDAKIQTEMDMSGGRTTSTEGRECQCR